MDRPRAERSSLVGENGQGKTNRGALHALSPRLFHRPNTLKELARHGSAPSSW